MSKVVSRAALYRSDDEQDSTVSSPSDTYIAPAFDFIEVDNTESVEDEQQLEEFDFPLFANAKPSAESNDEERGRSEQKVMKVSLREESLDNIKNERPQDYYFANYTSEQKKQFEFSALTAEDIYKDVFVVENAPWKVMDLQKHNEGVEAERNRVRAKNKREGKKKRLNKVACRERREKRAKLAKKLEKEKYFTSNRQFNKNRPRGNHKGLAAALAKPKYRTE